MRTNDVQIKNLMTSIDSGKIQLSDFQRAWVWEDERIKNLIASITNNYPVGAAMFLDYGNENVRFKYRVIEGSPSSNQIPNELILDRQQRLTSIYSVFFNQNPVRTRTDKGKEIKRYYYLNIEKASVNQFPIEILKKLLIVLKVHLSNRIFNLLLQFSTTW